MPWERFGSCRNYSDPLTISTQKRRSGGAGGGGFTSGNTVLWITGHSRGGALANLVASKRIDAGYSVFAYTFASPGTTTYANATADRYKSIFNIINEDDLVPQLPMSVWGFTRYGVPKTESIEKYYARRWDALVSGNLTYTSNKTNTENLVTTMAGIATGRNACYVYRNTQDGYVYASLSGYAACVSAYNSITALYPANTQPYWNGTFAEDTANPTYYYYQIYQQPAFLMQYMANAMTGPKLNQVRFAAVVVAPYLTEAKACITAAAYPNSSIDHPHYPESYYLLATELG